MKKRKKAEPVFVNKSFNYSYKNSTQKLAYSAFEQHDVLFLLGEAGTGKTFLSCAFAIGDILNGKRKKLVVSRPIVEAGESLGYLPGTFEEKVDPYMAPIYDCITKLVGIGTQDRLRVENALEIAPLAYLRGRSLADSVCILDEAQNTTYSQLKLFLTRLDEGSKMIICGDPKQSDLPGPSALMEVVNKLKVQPGISMVYFNSKDIVRHPLVAKILQRLGDL